MNKNIKKSILILLIFLFVLTISSVSAGDISVGGNGSDYQTLKNGVSNSQNGDNIYIESGTYQENDIAIKHDLTISSKENSYVVIDANNSKVFTVDKNAKLTLIGIEFKNAKSDSGSIIDNKGTSNIDNCSFSNCYSDGYGGVVYNEGNLTVTNSVIKNNIAESQGGFVHNEEGLITITNSSLINNQAARGGTIYNHFGEIVIDNCKFINNSCGKYGQLGGAIKNWGSATITNSIFDGNDGASEGGAIYNFYAPLTIKNCTFTNNTAISGQAIENIQYKYSPYTVNITESVFRNNGITNTEKEGKMNINYNTLINSTLAGENIDNSNNWWGSNNISGINATSWIIAAISTNPSTLIQNSEGTVYISLNNIYNNITKTTTSKNTKISSEVYLEISNYTQLASLKNGEANLDFNTQNSEFLKVSIDNQSFNIPIAKVTAEDLVKYYKNSSSFVVKTIANESVIFEINGQNYTRTSDENGTVSLAINLRPGNYTIKTYTTGTVINNSITVLSTITGKNIVKMYKNDTQFYAAFLKGDGSPLANTTVSFNINGVFYTRETDENGAAKLNINLRPGEYVLTAADPLTGLNVGYNVSVLPTIAAKSIVKSYLNETQFHATLLDEKGVIIANRDIAFNINGVFYTRATNSSGVATLNINLMPGKYILTAADPINGLTMGYDVTVLEKNN